MRTEHDEQKAFVKWFRLQYPAVRIFAIPNGGDRHLKVAVKLKAEGVTSGVPDLFVPEWLLWVEMKRVKKGVLSANQKDWRDYLTGLNHNYIVGHGCYDAIAKVQEFLRTTSIQS